MHDRSFSKYAPEIIEKGKLSQPAAASISPPSLPSGLWRRLFSFPTVLAGSLAYLVFIFSRRNIADPDLWWHLRNAQYLLARGHFPVVDSYSYTAPGAEVLPFEWLAEIPYYVAYKWAGLPAVFLLVFLLCTAIVLGIFRLSYLASHDVKNSFLVTVGGSGPGRGLHWCADPVVRLAVPGDPAADFGGGEARWLEMALAGAPAILPLGKFAWLVAHGHGGVRHLHRLRAGGRELGPRLCDALVRAATTEAAHRGRRLRRSGVYQSLRISSGRLSVPGDVRSAVLRFGNIQEFASVDFHTPWGKVAMVLILGVLLIAVFSRGALAAGRTWLHHAGPLLLP